VPAIRFLNMEILPCNLGDTLLISCQDTFSKESYFRQTISHVSQTRRAHFIFRL
jgi:hypothetical protein